MKSLCHNLMVKVRERKVAMNTLASPSALSVGRKSKLLRLIFVLFATLTFATACGSSNSGEDGNGTDDDDFSNKPRISDGKQLFDQAERIERSEDDELDGLWLEDGPLRSENGYNYRWVMQIDQDEEFMAVAKHCWTSQDDAYSMLRIDMKINPTRNSGRVRFAKDQRYVGTGSAQREPLLCPLTVRKGSLFYTLNGYVLRISNTRSMSENIKFSKRKDLD